MKDEYDNGTLDAFPDDINLNEDQEFDSSYICDACGYEHDPDEHVLYCYKCTASLRDEED